MLDLRLPSGLFFAITGLILIVLGVINPESRAPLTPLNINLYEGVAMVAFGAFLLLLSARARRRR
jgi:hypothetical protein